MKRFVATILTAAILLTLTSCSSSSNSVPVEEVKPVTSGITIDELANKINSIPNQENGKLNKEQAEDGTYTFSYRHAIVKGVSAYLQVDGVADENEIISYLTIVASGDLYTSELDVLTYDDLLNNLAHPYDLSPKHMVVDFFIYESGYIVQLLSGVGTSADEMLSCISTILDSRKTSQTLNGWKYSVSSERDSKITITAEFVGE